MWGALSLLPVCSDGMLLYRRAGLCQAVTSSARARSRHIEVYRVGASWLPPLLESDKAAETTAAAAELCHTALHKDNRSQRDFSGTALREAAVRVTSREAARRGQTVRKNTVQWQIEEKTNKKSSGGYAATWLDYVGWRPPLTPEEEVALSEDVKEVYRLENIKEQLLETLKRAPSDKEWTEAAELPSILRLYALMGKGRAAKRKIVQANSRLVFSIAYKYRDKGLPVEDLCQEGAGGLLHGARKYDSSKGSKFSAHSYRWISAMVGKAVMVKGQSMHLGPYLWRQRRRIEEEREIFLQRNFREATLPELAHHTGIDKKRVAAVLRAAQAAGVTEEVEDLSPFSDPWKRVELLRQMEDLTGALGRLRTTELRVLQKKFGFGGEEKGGKSRKEIALELNVREGQVESSLKTARRKLREVLLPLWEFDSHGNTAVSHR